MSLMLTSDAMNSSPNPLATAASAPHPSAPAPQALSAQEQRTWRKQLHSILFADPARVPAARALRILLCVCAAVSIFLYTLDTVRSPSGMAPEPVLFLLHVLTTGIFCIDYIARLYACVEDPQDRRAAARRWECMRRPEMLLELATLVPFFLGFWLPLALDLRFLRGIRLLHLIPSRRLAHSQAQLLHISGRVWPVTLALALALGTMALTLYGAMQAFSGAPSWEAAAGGTLAPQGLGSWSTPAAATVVFIVLLLLMLFAGLLLGQTSSPAGLPGNRYAPGAAQHNAAEMSPQPGLQLLNPTYILGKPEQAVAQFEVLLAQVRYLGVLTDHAQFEALAREGRLNSADYALWRHIQGYPLHPLQGGYGAQWRVRYSQPVYSLFTQASTQRSES